MRACNEVSVPTFDDSQLRAIYEFVADLDALKPFYGLLVAKSKDNAH